MFLKSLELVGFKSFAKRTVLGFDAGITAVVGPNGSGKSNIADAIRWVLGAQSKKAVRGKVSADVIFSGTGTKAAMGLAEVSLTFDNAKKLLPYDYDEVVITRRLYRSGDSEYLINGARVRLADLQHALAVAGIGAETYTVIGQGMVDRVLSQSAKDRRTMFEEAAGVRQFYLRRDEARRKLSETTTNLSRVEDILKELEPRLTLLRRQASVLEQREEIEGKLQAAYLAKFGHRYREVHGEFKAASAQRADRNREFLAISSELKTLTTEITELRKQQHGVQLNELFRKQNELRERQTESQAALGKAATAREVAKASRSQLELHRQQLADRLQYLEESTDKAPDASPDAQAAEQRYTKATKAFDGALDALAKAIEAKEMDRLTELVVVLKTAATGLKIANDGRMKHAAEGEAVRMRDEQRQRHEREVAAVQSQFKQVEKDLADRTKTFAAESEAVDKLTEQLSETEKELSLLTKEIETEQAKGTGNPEVLEKKEADLDAKRKTYDAYQSDLNGLNVELAKLETRLEDLHGEARTKLGDAFPPKAEQTLPDASLGEDANIAKLERKMLELGGIDPEVTKEHQEVEERHGFLSTQAEDLRKAKEDLERVIRQLERKSRTIFQEAFERINEQFGEHFKQLFGGGQATLTLVEEKKEEGDEASPTDYGIDIAATPPGKRLQSLAMLSGGERALTSVALLFAILKVNPSPFVMLDEVDAALDEANTGRFADTLKDLGESTQFIVVTHNRDTMRAAKMLYGVTMDETGISTMLSLKLPEAEKVAQGA